MKHIKTFFESFRVRVALVLVLAMFLMGFASDLIVQQLAIRAQFEQVRDKLKMIASAIALTIDPDMVKAIPLNRQGVQTKEYQTIFRRLEQVKHENPSIGFIYVMMRTDQENVLQFVVDPDPYLPSDPGLTAYPGDRYDATDFPEMIKAFNGPISEKEVKSDAWGAMISGYAPILDKKGNAIAIVGVDMLASDVYTMQKAIHRGVLLAFFIGIALSLLLGMWFSARLTGSIAKLADGIRRVSQGNLEFEIEVRGHDEVAELLRSFNRMAEDLRSARQKNLDYFYGIIRSLVLIVEARDPYTRGHSDRVAQYAVRIATRMGFSSGKVEMLKHTAVLHDIGKLGVNEGILTKAEKLTPEEWAMLKNHPVIGEDILRPVLLNSEMLAIIRGHHERYDGNGYPDKLAGADINIFTKILSVADAYDAMTSSRPYRSALSREQAIEELKKNRGTQFSPKVVDVFVKILCEEHSS